MILVVTRKDDIHADIVIEELEKIRAPVFRLNTECIDQYDICLSVEEGVITHRLSGRQMNTTQISAVYLRRRSLLESEIDPDYLSFVQSEWKALLRNLWVLIENAFWVSNPFAIDLASDKLLQLKVAKTLGFQIPETEMTNSLDSVRALKSHNVDLIYKAFNSGEISPKNSEVIYTSTVQEDRLDSSLVNEYSICPGIYQPKIPKHFELRVTVIGETVFTARINSQTHEKTATDWRKYDGGPIPHTAYELESDISSKCVALVKHFGLNFGAIDLIRNESGYVFLEINANGQWGWIQFCTGYPMAKEMAKMLVRGNE